MNPYKPSKKYRGNDITISYIPTANKFLEEEKVQIKKQKIFHKFPPKYTVDLEPINPVSNSPAIQVRDMQQWRSFVDRPSHMGIDDGKRKDKNLLTCEDENISVSSEDEPKIVDDPSAEVEVWDINFILSI